MSNTKVITLDPEQFYLLEKFCETEGIPMPDPRFSKVVAGIDLDTQEVVGMVAGQLMVHTEPIWIKKEYQGNGLWEEMSDVMEGYLDTRALLEGPFAVYNQPTNAAAERICRMRGYEKSDKPLWIKIYTGGMYLQSNKE